MNIDEIYEHFKTGKDKHYNEEIHCKLLLDVMNDPEGGTYGAFCLKARISEAAFHKWINKHELFRDIYYFGKLMARSVWEKDGRELAERSYPMGTIDNSFEHWKMLGWSRFGVGKNGRIKLNLDPNGTPIDHYSQVLRQASEGDFTAAEIKQLMEAVNVGLNAHQVSELQKQIDELKSDQATMMANTNVKNPFSNKGT